MAETSPSTPLLRETTTPSASIGRWLLLVTSILQAISPPFLPFNGTDEDPSFVPPGPFFSIWGVILIFSIANAIRGFPAQRSTSLPYRRIQIPLSLVHLGFIAWLLAASSSPKWVPITLPIFLAMLSGLVVCLRELQLAPAGSIDDVSLGLLGTGLGLYAGWSTAAIWLNAASLLPKGAFEGDRRGAIALQCVFVGGAVVSAAVGTYLIRGSAIYGYLAAAGWALIGVTVSGSRNGMLPAALTAGIGLVVIIVLAVVLKRE